MREAFGFTIAMIIFATPFLLVWWLFAESIANVPTESVLIVAVGFGIVYLGGKLDQIISLLRDARR